MLPAATATSHRTAFLVLIAGALTIALSPIFVRLSEIGPTMTAFWRVFLAAIPLWLLAVAEGRRNRAGRPVLPRSRRDVILVALTGFFFAGDLVFWHWAIQFTSVANSTLFANFQPIFVSLGAWVLFGERMTRGFYLGGALALVGAVILLGDSLSIGGDTLFGDALAIITAVFYGAYILAITRLRNRFSTFATMAWTSLITAAFILPVALAAGESLFPGSLNGWLVLLGLALISQAGGQSLITFSLAHLPAAFSSVSLLVQPVAAAVFAWVLLTEPLGPLQILGGIVVLCGIALARRASQVPPPAVPAPQ
ncbi:MAG: DMT family transporter [Rhodospirillaceae bacterium]|nr:DMT family transporter [Rhodospirillaceae bacterium]MCA8934336.1 DMT family transporter [Rhodospirillaceae bacterium]